MQTLRVSVIIPFSKPDVVEATLEKLVHQTYPADLTEIIVVGPGSNALANRWPIKAIDTHPIYYPGEARNIGAAEAVGDYFLF
ncbi:MAG: glycosyltransferase family 2 protein, partial [Ktedonobacteraceae bacterium]